MRSIAKLLVHLSNSCRYDVVPSLINKKNRELKVGSTAVQKICQFSIVTCVLQLVWQI